MKPIKSFVLISIIFWVVITSATGVYAQTLSATLSNYNGFNISCFGANDGSIDLTITGGTPPYSILWSNDETTEDLTGIPAGYYRVVVSDDDTTTDPVSLEFTLTEPRQLLVDLNIHKYPNNYNISVNGACNGSIIILVEGGIQPYSYTWLDGNYGSTRTNMCAGQYDMYVTDDNGCRARNLTSDIRLSEPPLNGWLMTGNVGTNPASQFIGTSDNTDISFRSDNTERMRIKADGIVDFYNEIRIPSAINFGNNNKVIHYQPAAGNDPEIFSFGARASIAPIAASCIQGAPNSIFQFNGLLQSWGTNSNNNTNMMEFGFDGANSVIDATGSSGGSPDHRLLLNYNCGKDVFVGNSSLGGDLYANKNFYTSGNAGFGTQDAQGYRVNINGDINISGDVYKGGILWNGSFWSSNNAGIHYTNGNIGIGTNNPLEKFQVNQGPISAVIGSAEGQALNYGTSYFGMNAIRTGSNNWMSLNDGAHNGGTIIYGTVSGDFNIATIPSCQPNCSSDLNYDNSFVQSNTNFKIRASDGHISMGGNPDNNFRLNVCGGIITSKLKVPANWCDYVFDDHYQLMPLSQLRSFISKNKHLPEVPTQKEIENGGVDVGSMLTLQMKKIEELTLYVLELEKRIDDLKNK
jgi:hypothetical protein